MKDDRTAEAETVGAEQGHVVNAAEVSVVGAVVAAAADVEGDRGSVVKSRSTHSDFVTDKRPLLVRPEVSCCEAAVVVVVANAVAVSLSKWLKSLWVGEAQTRCRWPGSGCDKYQ